MRSSSKSSVDFSTYAFDSCERVIRPIVVEAYDQISYRHRMACTDNMRTRRNAKLADADFE